MPRRADARHWRSPGIDVSAFTWSAAGRPIAGPFGMPLAWLMTLAVLLFVVAMAGVWLTRPAPIRAVGATEVCPAGAPLRTYDASLIHLPIALNRFGDVVPEGRMFILDENIATARATWMSAADPFNQKDVIEPLVLRANLGDCVEVRFTNRLNEDPPRMVPNADRIFELPGETIHPSLSEPHNPLETFDPTLQPAASMHFTGLAYDVKTSDGTVAGNNPSSVASPGQMVTYRLYADEQGEYLFQDAADLSATSTKFLNYVGSNAFGAFGTFVVEPEDSLWLDVNTGEPVRSGTRAIISDSNGTSYREFVLMMHDEIEADPGSMTRFCAAIEPAPAQPDPPESPPAPPGGTQPDPIGAPPVLNAALERERGCHTPTAEQASILTKGALLDGTGDGIMHAFDDVVGNEEPFIMEWFGFNYRSEPGFNRAELGCNISQPMSNNATVTCVGEETALSSWPFGDPGGGDLVMHSYRNEPMMIRLVHGAEKETHTFHWHIHRWPTEPGDEGGISNISRPDFITQVSNMVDVQAIGPGANYPLVPEGGAGSQQGTIGDVIFHCHLYPHFATGMWGLHRVHDVTEDGTRVLPDGEPVLPIAPVPAAPIVPAPTLEKPGFPFFVPGAFGFKAPKPPLGVPDRDAAGPFPPTQLEIDASLTARKEPGAFFVNPCPEGAPRKHFDFSAIQLPVEYNEDLQWGFPQHRIYILDEHIADTLAGIRAPEPFSALLNVGDCVEWSFTNRLPELYGGNVYDPLQVTNEVGRHPHLEFFDVLGTDGTANGWNYDQGADPGQTIKYQSYIQTDIKSNMFHDHFFPNVQQDAGLWGGNTVHPAGCTFHDPTTGAPIKVGLYVDIHCPGTEDDYRNFAMFVEDHVPMFQPSGNSSADDARFATPDGVPIFPPNIPGSTNDYGTVGINYRAEPFEARRGADPSEIFNSRRWGDPATPLLRAYRGDKISLDMLQLTGEESHSFNLHRWSWPFEPRDPESSIVSAQHLGILETFAFEIGLDLEDPNQYGLRLRDYLYSFGAMDDWFGGAWGIMRVYGCDTSQQDIALPPGLEDQAGRIDLRRLQPLPDTPSGRLNCNIGEVGNFQRTAGIPCPVNPETGWIRTPVKRFDVTAINKDIVYNEDGDHDPYGIMFALNDDLPAILDGTKRPEPLVLRVNRGDCVEVNLTNALDPAKTVPQCFEALEIGQLGFEDRNPGDAIVPTLPDCLAFPPKDENQIPGFLPMPVSSRISLTPARLQYEIGSDGANVGLNVDSTVPVGDTITYRWYADREYGTALLQDNADVQHHLHHGAFGAIIVEPEGSIALDRHTGAPSASGEQASIFTAPGGEPHPFREAVLLFNSDLSLFRASGEPVPDNNDISPSPGREANDPLDQGEFAINYGNAPWTTRLLGTLPAQASSITRLAAPIAYTGTGDPTDPIIAASLTGPGGGGVPGATPLEATLANQHSGDPSDPAIPGPIDPVTGLPGPSARGEGAYSPAAGLQVKLSNLDLARFPEGTSAHVDISKAGIVLASGDPTVTIEPVPAGAPGQVTGALWFVLDAASAPPALDLDGATIVIGSAAAPCTADALTCLHWSGTLAVAPELPPAQPISGVLGNLHTGDPSDPAAEPASGTVSWSPVDGLTVRLQNVDLARFPEGTPVRVRLLKDNVEVHQADVVVAAVPVPNAALGVLTGEVLYAPGLAASPVFEDAFDATVEVGSATAPCSADLLTCIH
ncbi:MAG: hypothetical protein HY873_07380, partial [Chloroflexi bacterium]|nr:hypothetical protein [Chloroflexota bacterium]